MYKRILVGVDGSSDSLKAYSHALELAGILQSTIDVLFVIPPRIYTQFAEQDVITRSADGGSQHISILQMEENELFDTVRQMARDHNLEVTVHSRVGDAVEGLIEVSSSHQIDLIVVGSSGKGMAGRLILGSVSTGVVHQSQVPVLVIKPDPIQS
jgi:nucleotide-binding universal stress UspA family protein